jgi:hypothetical protein
MQSRLLLFLLLSTSIYTTNTFASSCKYRAVKTEVKGDLRQIYKCKDAEAQDCELVGSLSKADMQTYSKAVDESRMVRVALLMAVTAPIGGATFSASKVGGMLVRFGKDAWKSFRAPLGTTQPPFAGLLKKHITETYSAKAAEIFSRSTYIAGAVPFGGAFGLSTDSVRGKVSSLASNFSDKETGSEVAEKTLGADSQNLKPDANACADVGVKRLEDSIAVVKTHQATEETDAKCRAMSLGRERARCLEDYVKSVREHVLVKNLGVEGTRNARGGTGSR